MHIAYRALFPLAFLIPAWLFAGWIILGSTGERVLQFILGSPIALVSLGILAFLIWVRPDARESRSVSARDLWMLLGVWLLWIVGAVVPGGFGYLVLLAAFLATALAISIEGRELRRVTRERLDAAGATTGGPTWPGMGPAGSAHRGPGGRAEGPDAGKVITLQPSEPSEPSKPSADAGAGARAGAGAGASPAGASAAATAASRPDAGAGADGRMPGSTRVGGGESPASHSTRPGVNFGDNRAPVAPDWDPARPVPDAEAGTDAEAPEVRPAGPRTDDETRDDAPEGMRGA